MVEEIFLFLSWDEVNSAIREIQQRCSKLEKESLELEGAIPVNRLKEVVLIKKRITQLDRELDVINESVRFLKTIPKVGKEAEVVGKKFSELYRSFKKLKKRIEKDFLGEE